MCLGSNAFDHYFFVFSFSLIFIKTDEGCFVENQILSSNI